LWLGLALVATLISIWLRIATAMSEIIVGTVAQLIIGVAIGATALGTDQSWIRFLASTGAVILTFLAGAELDPQVMRREWKQATIVGLVAFAAPFLGCAAVARYLIGWSSDASWLTGIALSTTSVAVVYAVMLEFGFNRTDYGKVVLAACFVNDLATVLTLGLKFSPFGLRTLTFAGGSTLAFFILPWLVPRFFARYGDRPSELEAKLLLLVMFGLGALALWAGSEPVLPAYILGMILASTVGKDHSLVRRLRTLTFGLLTPFYFIRAGSFVSASSLVTGFGVLCLLLGAKMLTKFVGVYPITKAFKAPTREAMYTTLLMSTGLTFGSISALFGLTHGIVDQKQYSYLIAAVIGSAIVPTLIANAFFLPRHLLPDREQKNRGAIESVLSRETRS
jgi:glutathione-regulated potassium-efflux system ancillary protein KefC